MGVAGFREELGVLGEIDAGERGGGGVEGGEEGVEGAGAELVGMGVEDLEGGAAVEDEVGEAVA